MMRSMRRTAIVGSVVVAVGVLTTLAASLASVAAGAKPSDVRATRAYLQAQRALYAATSMDAQPGATAAEDLAARLGRECPSVAANAPHTSAAYHELIAETSLALGLAYAAPIQQTLRGVIATLSGLRWSDRKLTARVHAQAAEDGLLTVPVPDLCSDWRAWAASGYKVTAPGTTRFFTEVSTVIGVNEELAAGELEAAIERRLKPYEGRRERMLQREVDHLRRLTRGHSSSGLRVAFLKVQAALGLHEALGPERPGASLIEPPADVLRADGRRLAEFELGRSVAAQSGCLACHRIGENGNAGPGRDLTHVGSRLSGVQIARAILYAKAPMPSFRRLPEAKLQALVEFLSLLK
jgi:mono/diheme cytochrome c family protein